MGVKKIDLNYYLVDIQSEILKRHNIDIIEKTISDYYGEYFRECILLLDNGNEDMRRLSNILSDGLNKLHIGYAKKQLKPFPTHYPEEIHDYYGGEIIGYYISTERLNGELPCSDDLRIARFLKKHMKIIMDIIKARPLLIPSKDLT